MLYELLQSPQRFLSHNALVQRRKEYLPDAAFLNAIGQVCLIQRLTRFVCSHSVTGAEQSRSEVCKRILDRVRFRRTGQSYACAHAVEKPGRFRSNVNQLKLANINSVCRFHINAVQFLEPPSESGADLL
jgi:hypothetical protein